MNENALLNDPATSTDRSSRCRNCGAELTGRFCAHCGQRAGDRVVSMRQILADTLEDQFSWNSALPRTLKALLLRPGLLTTEYASGRIARYIPPMRLYLAASLLFFLVLSFRTGLRGGSGEGPAIAVNVAQRESAPTSTGAPAAGGASGGITIDTATGPSWLRSRLAAQQRRLATMSPGQRGRVLFTGFMDAAPKVVFLLLPVFALLLKLLYIRRRRLYVEHFIFALHLHAVAFLVFAVFALLRSAWLNLALFAWLTVYACLALRRVYGQGWGRTLTKFFALGVAYFFVVLAGIIAGALLVVLTA